MVSPYYCMPYFFQLTLDHEDVLKDEETTLEIKECCKDIKVLGRKDLKMLMNWGKEMAKKYFSDDKDKIKKEEESNEKVEVDEVKLSDDEKELLDMDEKINVIEVNFVLFYLYFKLVL